MTVRIFVICCMLVGCASESRSSSQLSATPPDAACDDHPAARETSWYRERPEPVEVMIGKLEYREPTAPTVDERNHHFFLDGVPVYTGAKGPVFDALKPFAGKQVKITGKRVTLPELGNLKEIWPGSLCSL